MDWRADRDNSELFNIVDMVWVVEEIDIAQLQSLCEEHGIELVFVYLPPALRGQPHLFTELNEDIVREFGEGEDVLASSDRIADDWIEHLEEEGVAYVDLRSTFGASEELYYWHTDHHINVAGHAAAAKAVQPVIEAIVAGD